MRPVNERLTYLPDSDLTFLVRAVATQRLDHEHIKEIIRDKADLIDIMLDDPEIMAKIQDNREALLQVSPYLFFTILLRQVKREMQKKPFTLELLGSAEEIPIFDSPEVTKLLENAKLLDYLAELLASFTRTYSGVLFYKAGNRWERRRFSELEIDDLLTLSRLVDPETCFPIYKRLGDVSLFLTGIFPAAIVRRAHLYPARRRQKYHLEDYLEMGPQFYQKAATYPEAQQGEMQEVLQVLSNHFTLARKPLNLLAQRYMGFNRYQWFNLPAEH